MAPTGRRYDIYPYSRKVIEEHFVNVPEDERRMIVCDNAAKLYGLV